MAHNLTPLAGSKQPQAKDEITLIQPTRGLAALNLRDLWIFRELIYFLTWRDLKVRYKQTLLGASWAILQPVLQMVVFTLLFDGLANLDSDGVPYPIFNYTALLPWGLFSKALSDAGKSLVQNRNMITKVYFPRLVIPLASVLGGVVDFAVAFVVLIGLMVYYHFTPGSGYQFTPSWALLSLIPLLLLALVAALGASLWLSAANVLYRDIGYVLPFLSQIWFFATPIVYSSSSIPEQWRFLYALNPMVGVIDGFRWALLGTPAPNLSWIGASAVVALVLLVTGLVYFRRMERSFADEI
jgi:lipopolysaccharide transport system permease protein